MALSDLPPPAEASVRTIGRYEGFAQAGNRCPSPIGVEDMLFGAMRYSGFTPALLTTSAHLVLSERM